MQQAIAKRKRIYGPCIKQGKSDAKKALALAMRIKSQLNVEYKHIDVADLSLSAVDTGTVTSLTPIAEGDDNTNREGRSIRAKSIQLKALIESNTTANTTQTVRIIIFKDNQNQGSTPSMADVLKASTTLPIVELRETDEEQGRFKVYYDKVVNLHPPFSGVPGRTCISFYKKTQSQDLV